MIQIDNQYDFFKNVKLDDDGNLLVSLNGGSDVNVNLGPVLDNTISTPPPNPSEGDRYIIPTGATGVWSANTNDIAQWNDVDNEWQFYIPTTNDRTIVTTGTNAGKVYEFNGTAWTEVIVPVVNSTPFVLAGTSIDAGSNKTSRIARTGDVVVGATNTGLTGKHVVFGSSLSSTYVTRNAYASTSDITRTGNWFRVMSFECNYSVFAAHHYKFVMAFNGNSDGRGFNAEMDLLIKRQNNQIFISSNITQSKNGTELVYDTDKNIEFLWNNTTKRVTMYFRPDLNYSQLSFTILTPRESTNRFTFLNQYTAAADLSGEVSDVFTEKSIVIGNTLGNDFGMVSSKTKLFNETSQNTTIHLQSQTTHLFGAEYGDGTYQSSLFLNPETLTLSISENTNGLSNNVQLDTNQNYFNLYDSINAIGNSSTQNVGSSQETITDANTGTYTDVYRDTTDYQIGVVDGSNQTASGLNLSVSDVAMYSSIEDSDKSGQIRVEGEAIISTVDDKSGPTVASAISQSTKEFALNFQDDDLSIDNTVEFNQTKLILPDGYNIESSYQPNPDLNNYISVANSNAQGQAIAIASTNFSLLTAAIQTFIYDEISTRVGTTTDGFTITQNTSAYTIQTVDQNHTYFGVYPSSNLIAIRSTGNILLSDLPVYADDAAADADVDLIPGSLYKLTGSRAVYQKP
jgi:hypothetical protein